MLETLQSQPRVIIEIVSYARRLSDGVAQHKAVARLVDGSNLHVNEVWVGEELRKYAYYQVTPTGEVIQGWDNAPHHAEVSTFPHHHHLASGVEASAVRSLKDVIDHLADELT